MSWPHILSFSRIVAGPLIAALTLRPPGDAYLAAAILFGLATITDLLDGQLARYSQRVSDLGVFLDTTADKILVCLTLVAMTAAHLTPIWIPLVIIGREFLISGLRSFAAACGRVISAHIWGKGKTAVTMIAIFCVLTAADGSAGGALSHIAPRSAWTDVRSASQWLLGISAVLTIISGLRYVVDAWPLFRPIAPVSGRASDPELDERTPLAAGDA